MMKLSFMAVALHVFVGLSAMLTASAAETTKPNVLLIMADDLGWRDTSCYGSTFYETPHIDRLAESGMRFVNGFSSHQSCSPTRCSVLTGQYPIRTGFTSAAGHLKEKREQLERTSGPGFYRGLGPSTTSYLDTSYYTLGEAMKDAGYATSLFGKWHLGHKPYIPEAHGFDYVRGGRHHPGPPGKDPNRQFYPPWKDCETLDSNLPANTHVDDYITDLAIEHMRDMKKQDKPFFMCYWPYSVHAPFQSKPELIEKWKKRVDPNAPQRSPTMAAMIEVLDQNVGRLMKALDKDKLADNTIVLFLSDNGGNMYNAVDGTTPTNNYPLRNGKSSCYDGGLRIPFMVRWSGVTKAKTVSDAIVSTTDLYATLLEMTGQPLRPQDHKDSVSFVDALKGKPFRRPPMISDAPAASSHVGNIPNTSVRHGKWKLYRYWFDASGKKHRYELYDLDADIGETKDVAAANPQILSQLIAFLDDYLETPGIKQYHPNANYAGRRVGTKWETLSDQGEATLRDGVLTLTASKAGFGVRSSLLPRPEEPHLCFEMRSATETGIKVQLTKKTTKTVSDAKSKTASPIAKWQSFYIPLKPQGNQAVLQLSLASGGTVELRNIQMTTRDGTVMMRYSGQ
ncbi:sulfatase [Rhodopirellula sp. SWK7]|uniref:sulfatase n=1 Tax=Rhodopirellula sp. SWK7 TaxID=595460 RepID=UPI0002BDAA81|nr:sulfatase [Rhodopirellula sp. SWK7]EMI43783.1 N-acetylgalactosamine 6-sulfate sulfatase (GALNS) [Rhodopirellula sp. SWK7]